MHKVKTGMEYIHLSFANEIFLYSKCITHHILIFFQIALITNYISSLIYNDTLYQCYIKSSKNKLRILYRIFSEMATGNATRQISQVWTMMN